ncbi:hypothetical protein FHR32_001171 [Streptosporangium album]|uniref:Uncharacterized protein n=1 Tax=Streptosporangium album TaxID=47479 RepID=A0A7W7RSS2_9ACTN|nr:hypothetical protein [Streptosporangium album]MBB4936866.1 hypothetical protein [Streptosporangium album]
MFQFPQAPPVHEQARLDEVGAVAGLPEQLDQGHLDLGVTADALLPAGPEPLHHQVGELHRRREQPPVAHPPPGGDRGLDEVAQVVELVTPGEVFPRLLRARRVLEEGVQVAVLGLHPLKQFHDLVEELPRLVRRGAGADLVRHPFDRAPAKWKFVRFGGP